MVLSVAVKQGCSSVHPNVGIVQALLIMSLTEIIESWDKYQWRVEVLNSLDINLPVCELGIYLPVCDHKVEKCGSLDKLLCNYP